MKAFSLALAALAFLALPALAQDQGAPPAAAGGPPPSAVGGGAGGGMGGGGSDKNKEIVTACRTEAKGKGLKGPEMKQAVVDCVAKQKPKLAERLQCRMQGKQQGKSGDELKAFVKDCMKGKG